MSSAWGISTPLVGRSGMRSCNPTFHRHLGGWISHNIPTQAKESVVPCSIVPIWHIMKGHDPPQPPLPLTDPNSEAHTTSIIFRKSALCEGGSTMHQNGRVHSNTYVCTLTDGAAIQRNLFPAFSLFRVSSQVGIANWTKSWISGFSDKEAAIVRGNSTSNPHF